MKEYFSPCYTVFSKHLQVAAVFILSGTIYQQVQFFLAPTGSQAAVFFNPR
jgi:hypothetical protein